MPLTEAQRNAIECPDCGFDEVDRSLHKSSCRRVARSVDLQCGPPWNDWPDGPDEPERVPRR